MKQRLPSWKTISYSLLFLIIGLIIGIIATNVYDKVNAIPSSVKYEIVVKDIKATVIKPTIDSLNIIKLENTIALVEKKNDGRFEVLAWASTLALSLLGFFVIINFIVSSAKVRELVDEELDKRHEEINQKIEEFQFMIEKANLTEEEKTKEITK